MSLKTIPQNHEPAFVNPIALAPRGAPLCSFLSRIFNLNDVAWDLHAFKLDIFLARNRGVLHTVGKSRLQDIERDTGCGGKSYKRFTAFVCLASCAGPPQAPEINPTVGLG